MSDQKQLNHANLPHSETLTVQETGWSELPCFFIDENGDKHLSLEGVNWEAYAENFKDGMTIRVTIELINPE